jgi:hypothetical protein
VTPLLRPRPVAVRAGAARLVVEPAWADVWIEALSATDPVRAVVPAMCNREGQEELALALVEGHATAKDIIDAAWLAMADAGDRDWWVVMRLARLSLKPPVFAALLMEGVRPEQVTLAAWIACTYQVCSRGLDEKGAARFEFDLINPPPGLASANTASFDAVQF